MPDVTFKRILNATFRRLIYVNNASFPYTMLYHVKREISLFYYINQLIIILKVPCMFIPFYFNL